MASPVSAPYSLVCWAAETTATGERAPVEWLTLTAVTFIGHDRDEHACECAHGLLPWRHCPAHRNRARNYLRMGWRLGGPYWGPNAEAEVAAGEEAVARMLAIEASLH